MPDPRSYFITGTSSGIGRHIALHLAKAGARIFATVRREEDASSLRALGLDGIVPVRLDVTDAASLSAGVASVDAVLGGAPLHGLVNNAGVNVGGVLEGIAMETLRRQFEVNVFGVVALTQQLLPLLRRSCGRIVNISSAGAALPTPFGGAYAASKIALEALTHAWRRELQSFGVFACVVRPGATESAIWGKSGADVTSWRLSPEVEDLYRTKLAAFARASEKMKSRVVPSGSVVRAVEHALTARRPRVTYIVGAEARASYLVDRLLPDRLVDRVVERMLTP
jgi:NAD(P)-dependent dehydrogenase (short-subunit alcohol dehydrogenase family)